MPYITHVRVTCEEQEDYTGSDDIEILVESATLGQTSISAGETKDLSAADLYRNNAFIDAGQTIYVKELDLLDPNDTLLTHTVTQDEIQNGLTVRNTGTSAKYVFEFSFEPGI
jgi:hypothetical protein